MKYAHIINENDIVLNAIGYFNVDHELEWWMWVLMNILLYFLHICFAIRWILWAQMANYIGKLN
jgi:hypothetical protein